MEDNKMNSPVRNDARLESALKNPLGHDNVGRLILKFAVPNIVSMIVNALYNMVDQIFIGNGVGYLGNAATNVILPITVTFLGLGLLLGDGAAAYFALQNGKGETEEAAKGLGSAITVSLVLSVVLSALALIFLEPLCRAFGASDNVLPLAMDYGGIIILGLPFMAFGVTVSGCIRADGSPMFSMMGLLLGCVMNIILDPLFIFVFGWGVKGAAFATILGQMANAFLFLTYMPKFKNISLKKKYLRPKLPIVAKVASLGVSSFITQISIVVVIVIANRQLVSYGALSKYGQDIPLSAHGVTMKVNQIVTSLIIGLSVGAAPVMGFNYGAGLYDRVKKAYFIILRTSLIIGTLAFLAFQFFPIQIISIFGSESELYNEFAVKCMRIFLMLICVNGLQMSTGVFFQSIGHPLPATILSMSRQILIFVPAAFILPSLFGVDGMLYVGPVADGVAFVLALILLFANWKRVFKAPDNALPR
ncbi:MAG: MATE family efflux transporter [Eubacteriales bacterium]|nr:MATE family efflux transporter [Eubacteriales bacterium]MDD3883015.1 MATE family efflux transporter [Eubacteriales bacterium]MDD4513658.1 MATE family efflux transporter [Eubacteriales bacterium]